MRRYGLVGPLYELALMLSEFVRRRSSFAGSLYFLVKPPYPLVGPLYAFVA